MSDDKSKLEQEAKVPPWLSPVIAPVIGLALLLAELFEVPERLGFERPASTLITGSVGGFLIWTWLVHYAKQWRPVHAFLDWASKPGRAHLAPNFLLAILRPYQESRPVVLWLVLAVISGCAYVGTRLLIAYASEQAGPLTVFTYYALVMGLILLGGATWVASQTRRVVIATCLAGSIALIVLLTGVFRPEEWYFAADTLFVPSVQEGQVGILLAPYDFDEDASEHQRLRQELEDLLRKDEALRRHVDLKLLPRQIPGYTKSGTVILNEENEQTIAARRIGFYLRGPIVTFGADLKELVKTRVLLVGISDPENPLFLLREINIDGPKQDAVMLHFLAGIIAGIVETTNGGFKSAEAFFDGAIKDAETLQGTASTKEAFNASIIPALRLFKAASIVRAISSSNAAAARSEEALRILNDIKYDPASGTQLRTAAAINSGVLWRNLSQFHADPSQHLNDLDAAATAYMSALSNIPSDADPLSIAGAWNGLGVVYEKEADAKADPASLRQAEEAYTKGLEWLQKAGEGEKPITQRSRNRLLASIQNNLGVAQAKQGIRERSAAELKRAIASYEEARRSITSAPDPLLEPLLISNLAEAYYHLAEHEDRAENLKRARSFLSEALALPGTSNYPAIRGEVLYKFGEVDLALGDPRLGVHELACAFDIFDRAGRDDQARIVLKTMRLLPTPTVQRLLGDKTVSIAGCRWDEAKLMQRLLSL